jgi:hypothetical protein
VFSFSLPFPDVTWVRNESTKFLLSWFLSLLVSFGFSLFFFWSLCCKTWFLVIGSKIFLFEMCFGVLFFCDYSIALIAVKSCRFFFGRLKRKAGENDLLKCIYFAPILYKF